MREYNRLDKEIYNICCNAEKRCRTTVSGTLPWSPKLVNAIKNLLYWRARKKYGPENRVVTKLGEETSISYEYHTEDKIQEKINVVGPN